MIKLYTDNIQDQTTREVIDQLVSQIVANDIIKGSWKFIELNLATSATNLKIPHGFRFIPKDKIELSVKGPGVVTWNYSLWDRTNINITTTDACTIRALIGSYAEEG